MEQKEILQRIAFPVERTSHFDKCGMSFDRGTILGPTTKLASCHWHCSRTWHSAHLPFQTLLSFKSGMSVPDLVHAWMVGGGGVSRYRWVPVNPNKRDQVKLFHLANLEFGLQFNT